MKILIDIGHPAHVHLFKNLAWKMIKNGHDLLFTCRDKEYEIFLLKKYNFNFVSFGKKYYSLFGKIWGLVEFDIKEIITGFKFKPDILISHGSIYAAHAALFLRKPHISLEDTGNKEQVNLYLPFTSCVLTSDFFEENYYKKQIRYSGYHELAYLHTNYFTPDKTIFSKLNLNQNEKFVILRFVSWGASHDIGHKGLSDNIKLKLVELLSKYFKVFISSEKPLHHTLEKYSINISPDKIHDVLYYASMFIGEGTTMAMEAGILGTPSIYINSLQYSNINNLAKYGLVKSLKNDELILSEIVKIIRNINSKEEWIKKRNVMLKDKIDVTSFLVWFIENYKDSFYIMKNEPSFQFKFK